MRKIIHKQKSLLILVLFHLFFSVVIVLFHLLFFLILLVAFVVGLSIGRGREHEPRYAHPVFLGEEPAAEAAEPLVLAVRLLLRERLEVAEELSRLARACRMLPLGSLVGLSRWRSARAQL